MVTCKLWAGLGNQAFMIAAVLGYAKKHGMNYFLPPTTIAPHIWKTHFPQFPTQRCPPHYVNYKEPKHSYSEIPKMDFIQLEGYFQSAKYFDHCKEDIINAFQIPYKKMEGYVSIHVRRGDYLNYKDKHPPVTEQYLADAILYMAKIGFKSFLVCSDDIKWCKETFSRIKGAEFIYSNNRQPIEDLALMSCCEHNIIANSSFSWWSAWLNQNPNKIVISPHEDNWFGINNKHLSVSDLIPEQWVRIKY